MAGVRGIRSPYPTKGSKETGIFSSKGSQKKDPLSGKQGKYSKYTGSNYRMDRVDPKKGRSNG